MAKKKKYKGNYCKICGEIKANEQFTGKGHTNHICKKCLLLDLEIIVTKKRMKGYF